MKPFRVREFTTRFGEEAAILVGPDDRPLFWPNVYATGQYRNSGKSPRTTAKVLRTLGMVETWAQVTGRDIARDLTTGDFLSIADVEDLADFLGRPAEQQRASVGVLGDVRPAPKRSATRLERVRPDHRKQARKHVSVDPAEIATRIGWVAAYLEWHRHRRIGRLDRHGIDSKRFDEAAAIAIQRLRQLVPRARGKGDDETVEGIDAETVQIIETLLAPASAQNPFRTPFLRARNYLIWRLFLDTGARRGEIQPRKVKDIIYAERRLAIGRSKTRARTVPISSVTAQAFDDFVMEHWARLPLQARKRGYLFTSDTGAPLSLRAFNRLFERIRERVPSLPPFISPHTMRRTWNDTFSATIDARARTAPVSPREEQQIRSRLMGWSSNSRMAQRYAARHIRLKADEVAESLLNDVRPRTRRQHEEES